MVQWKRLGEVLTKEARAAWLLSGGIFVAWAVSYATASHMADQVAFAGTVLQLLGLGTAALGIKALRKIFEKRSLKDCIWSWVLRLLETFRKPNQISGTLNADSVVCTSSMTGGVLTASGPLTLEMRVDALEKAIAAMRTDHDKHVEQVKSDISRVEGLVNVEATTREVSHKDLFKRLENVAVGGLGLEVIGLAWLVLGVLGTSIPKTIANHLPDFLVIV